MKNIDEILKIVKKLKDKELAHYASSLSFHTILALIPILLISLSIFTKLPSFKEHYEKIQNFIFSSLIPTQQELISSYLNKFISNTGSMGTMGLIFVLYISIMFFFDYEKIISSIFKIKPRSLWEAISTYWTMLTMMPLGLAISFFISQKAQDFLSQSEYTNSINILIFAPYLIIWFLFFIAYSISVNLKIKKRFALISSFVASLVWYVSKTLFVYYVAYNKTYLSIYGSFSVVMFFFLWIYFSWLIYLYGIKLYKVLDDKYSKREEKSNKSQNSASDT